MSNLYKNNTTGFLGYFRRAPDPGWTAIDDMPAGPLSDIVAWWRALDLDGAESSWHPTTQAGDPEIAAPPGLAGSGVNIMPRLYSSFDGATIPVMYSNLSYELYPDGYNTTQCLRVKTTGANAYIWLCAHDSDWPIKLTGNRRWIISAYTRCPVALQPYTVRIKLDTGTLLEIDGASGPTANAWQRQAIGVDFSQDPATRARIGVKFTSSGADMSIDCVMMEEFVGTTLLPSAFVDGV